MIPKVAANLLHASKSPNFPAYIRNVLQFQSAVPSAASPTAGAGAGGLGWSSATSSSWGGSAGAGGAKYNAGSKFYSGYTGPGRAITQANSSSSNDSKEGEEQPLPVISPKSLHSIPGRRRPRSASLSLPGSGRKDRAESLGVFKAVQLHTRARHVFARSERAITDTGLALILTPKRGKLPRTSSTLSVEQVPSRTITRRNSTSALNSSPLERGADFPPFLLASQPTASASKEASPDSSAFSLRKDSSVDEKHANWDALYQAKESKDVERIKSEIDKFRQGSPPGNTALYNLALDALVSTRSPGQPINPILELYNEMLSKELLANSWTYHNVITALCERDHEVQKVLIAIDQRIKRLSSTQTNAHIEELISEQKQSASSLHQEGNFNSALALFRALTASKSRTLPITTYNYLLRSSAYHANVDAAILVYSHLEQNLRAEINPFTFAHLIAVYAAVGDYGGAQEVFKEYLHSAKLGTLSVYGQERTESNINQRSMVWNKMIEAGFLCGQPDESVKLFEQMLDSRDSMNVLASTPRPSASTYTVIVQGFCRTGDIDTALAWFDQLLAQKSHAKDIHAPLTDPVRPSRVAWVSMLGALLEHNRVDDLNRLFPICVERHVTDELTVRGVDVEALVDANIRAIRLEEENRGNERLTYLQDILTRIAKDVNISVFYMQDPVKRVVEELVRSGRREDAARLLETFSQGLLLQMTKWTQAGVNVTLHRDVTLKLFSFCARTIFGENSTPFIAMTTATTATLQTALSLVKIAGELGDGSMASHCVRLYEHIRTRVQDPQLCVEEWGLLVDAYRSSVLSYAGGDPVVTPGSAVKLLEDLTDAKGIDIVQHLDWKSIAKMLEITHGPEQARVILNTLNQFPTTTTQIFEPSSPITLHSDTSEVTTSTPPTSVSATMEIDHRFSQAIDGHQDSRNGITALAAFDIFENGAKRGVHPTPESLGHLINSLGRLQELSKVQRLYMAAQDVLGYLEYDKEWQSQGWFQVEDQMIIALAHSGLFDAASIHRTRIIDHGGAPSADAYGALIAGIKDTTDDHSVARDLWDESQRLGVVPNLFLYNTIISKLAKARKADYALELFRRMRVDGVRPSSVTYGAVIGACCRVGDEGSAEFLFSEMTAMKNFKPRVPPYNTMIQFYTSTKPNRERALYYYNSLVASGVKPTGHTYKLLLDAYGSIEPADTASMESTFAQLVNDTSIQVNGTHWASLINAWGFVCQDLDRALAVFDSIATHPATRRSSTIQPDAVAFEALINCLVTMKRIDLLPQYLQRLSDSGIHMTAYIANILIKGYAAAGNITMARDVFESLHDAPVGIAAPFNHTTHDGSVLEHPVRDNLVYREPSTWEAMVRAELGVSDRAKANDLLLRMESRMFPPAVTARIRGILGDEILVDE